MSKYHLIGIDLPGHGKSSPLTSYDIPFFSKVISSFLKQLNVTQYILAGHSLGGHICVESLDQLTPKGIAIWGTPPLKIPLDISAFKPYELGALLYKNNLSKDEAVALASSFYNDHLNFDQEIFDIQNTHQNFRELFFKSTIESKYKDEYSLLENYLGAKMILHGENDHYINLNYISNLSLKDLWNNQITTLPGGHCVHKENFKEFNYLLAQFAEYSFSIPKTATIKTSEDHLPI